MVDLNHYLMKEIEIQKRISNSALKDFFEINGNFRKKLKVKPFF